MTDGWNLLELTQLLLYFTFYSLTRHCLSVCVVIKYLKIVEMMMKDEGPIRCQHEADDDLTAQEGWGSVGLQVEATRQSHH